jgi:hypothetical protein
MACKAMALLSSDTVPTCSVSTGRDGRRIAVCGYVPAPQAKSTEPAQTKPAESAPSAGTVYAVHVSWTDNSDNESNFIIERCDQVKPARKGEKTAGYCVGRWRSIATVGANTRATSMIRLRQIIPIFTE